MDFREIEVNGSEGYEGWDDAQERLHEELERSTKELHDIQQRIEHSQAEVNNLANRNAAVTAKLQQIQGSLESTSRSDIRVAYDRALEALQRLFVMRGQLERLQSEEESMGRYVELLERVNDVFMVGTSAEPGSAASFASMEMMIQAQESERQRLSRQMHDGPAQALANFILQTEIASRLFEVDQDQAREELQVLKNAAKTTFQQVKDFIFQLRPMMLDDLGLIPTINRFVDGVKEQSQASIIVAISGEERRLEPYLEVVVFRSIQEILDNALRHSQASEVRLQLDVPTEQIRASIDDNGKGFDTIGLDSQGNIGLTLIKERVEMLGGSFDVDSVIGQGTRVAFDIPITMTPVIDD
jgi:two-component system sensor histidine kinase DegS